VDVFTQPFCKKKNKGPCSPVKMLKGYMVRERLENPALVVCDDRPGGRSQVLYKIILFTESMWIWKRRCYWKISRLTRELAHKKSWCHEHELRYIIIEPAKPNVYHILCRCSKKQSVSHASSNLFTETKTLSIVVAPECFVKMG